MVSHSMKLRACSSIRFQQRAMIRIIRWMRNAIFGISSSGRLLVVAHVQDDDVIRIITARLATGGERKLYEEG
jgi:uncharacterized DUF497 family protein